MTSYTQTHRGEGHVWQRLEWCSDRCRDAKVAGIHQELGERHGAESSLAFLEENNPADTLISDFWPLELWKKKFPWKQTHPLSFNNFYFFFNLRLMMFQSTSFLRLINLFYFTTLYWFCHTLTWIHHGCTCVPHPEPPSHLPPHPIPLGHPCAPGLSILYHASNLDWWFISQMIIYMFQCHSPISSHPCPLPQSPKDCSIHLCLSCCLAYRVIIIIFLNSIYIC